MRLGNTPVIHIACAIDDSFSYPLSVMLVSLLENNKQNKINIHLFSASLSADHVVEFKNLIKDYHQEITFYKIPTSVFEKFRVNDRISQASYYRILVPEIINAEVKKILYLDADILINGDISGLYNTELHDNVLGAINDIAAIDWQMHKKHSIPDEYLYFNAGVLLINRHKWLTENTTKRVLAYLEQNKEICDYHDQDGLNGVLYNSRQTLSPKWNQQIGIYFIKDDLLKQVYESEYQEAIRKPVVIHFNGIEKPWHYVSAHPFRKLFDKYAGKMKYFNFEDQITPKKFIKRHLIYLFIGWKNTNRHYYYKTRPIK